MGRFFWLKLIIRQEKPSRVFLFSRLGDDFFSTCAEVLVPCKVTRIGSVTSVTLKFGWRDGWMDTPPAVPTVQKETTVDGRNPAPVDRLFIPLFIGFHTSQVVQDFSHQQ